MSEKPNQDPVGSHHHHHGGPKPPDSGVEYFTKVDGDTVTFDHQFVTGREVLHKAGKTPSEHFDLYLKLHGGPRKLVGLDETVDLGAEGIEKFLSIPKKRTDGREDSIRPPLTAEDAETLSSSELEWEVIEWQGNLLVTVKGWKVPQGYNVDAVNVRFIVPMTYPSAQLDMFYFFPSILRKDGAPIPATTNQDFNGEVWQRWSRHRTPESAWRPGVDDIGTHLGYMAACLREEIEGKK